MSAPPPCSDFSRTHLFCTGVFLITVYVGKYKQIDSKKRIVVFEKGTRHGSVVQRLAVYKSRGAKLFSAGSDQPCFLMSLNDNDLQGLLKGIQRRRVRYSQYVYSPTVTIVTKEATVVLAAAESDYERSMRQHDDWYSCLKNKLDFGGYWIVEHETGARSGEAGDSSAAVTLCVSGRQLTLLSACPYDDNVYDIDAEYSVASIVCWKFHFGNRRGSRVATLSITVAPNDADHANFKTLLLRIDHNETIAGDISDVLSQLHLPQTHAEAPHRLTPAFLDLQLRRPYRASSSCRQRAPDGKRQSRDDLELLVARQVVPVCPPPRTQPHQHVLNSYDLNALSCTDSVKDAVHFYENIDNLSRPRPRRPPDVVASHLDEDEEYWSMVFTLREVLRRKKPEPDTLGLMPSHRLLICFLLLDDSIPSWKNLAEHIGLKHEAVKMIEILFRWNAPCDDVTPTECILRHWQFVYNRSLATTTTGSSSSSSSSSSAPPCTLASLINILDEIGRHDLVVRLSELTPAAIVSS